MTVTSLRVVKRKARKVHPCSLCGGPAVQPGEEYTRETFAYDGTVYDWISCAPCLGIYFAVYDWVSYDDEGISSDHYDEWASEYADDPEHGEASRAYLARRKAGLSEPSNSGLSTS